MSNKCLLIDVGLIHYEKAWKFQEEIHSTVINQGLSDSESGIVYNSIIFCEHTNVYTLGKSGKENNLLINNEFLKKINASYVKTNRGGDITYHGPGQIVGYPIFNLHKLKIGVKKYIYLLEQSIIDTLKVYSVDSDRLEGATGVWLDINKPGSTRKICAIGVRLSRSVTMHGFALNVNTDLTYFNYINPCGLNDKGVTSLERELGKKLSIDEIKESLLEKLKLNFNLEIIRRTV